MQPTAITASVLSTIATLGSDVTTTNNTLSITGCPAIDSRTIQLIPSLAVAPVAETLGVTTVTFTAANSTTYTMTITQKVQSLGRTVVATYTYVSLASGDTATTIANAFRAMMANSLQGLNIAATGTATLILTSVTPDAIATVTGNWSTASGDIVNGTPGVYAIGSYVAITNYLASQGITAGGTGTLASGHTYNTTIIDYARIEGNMNNTMTDTSLNRMILYADVAATNYARFLIALVTAIFNTGFNSVNTTPQYLTGTTLVVDLTHLTSEIITTGAATGTLAAGTEGQFKIINLKTDGGDYVLTVTNLSGGTTITFGDAGDAVLLRYVDSLWVVVSNQGCAIA